MASVADRALVHACKEVCTPHDSLSGKDVPLKLARRRYKHLAERFRITHGLISEIEALYYTQAGTADGTSGWPDTP